MQRAKGRGVTKRREKRRAEKTVTVDVEREENRKPSRAEMQVGHGSVGKWVKRVAFSRRSGRSWVRSKNAKV